MIYALYYQNQLIYKRACKTLLDFKHCVYNKKADIFRRADYSDLYNNFNKIFNGRINCSVEGWRVIHYKNYKSVLPVIQTPQTQRKGRTPPVSNVFYVFDTESTNYKNKYAFTYLYGIKPYFYNYNINDDNLRTYSGDYKPFYGKKAIKEFTEYLKAVNNHAERDGELVYIYVHNLIYDLYELLQNVLPNFEYTKTDYINTLNDSIFRGAPTKPLRFRIKNLVFVDSLALTNKSLKKISKNHKIKKLVDNKTYKEQYFFNSELPIEELEYNEHDLDVTALGVMDSIRSLKQPFETFNDYVKTYACTVTGISKYLNKHIYKDESENKELLQKHTSRASYNLPIDEHNQVDKFRLLFYQAVFGGGFTHANPFAAYNVMLLSNTKINLSFDKKSHYPACMEMRYFPFGFEVYDEDDKLNKLIELHEKNRERAAAENYETFIDVMLNFKETIKNGKIYSSYFNPCPFHFLADVTLENVNIKTFNNNCMPLIAVSKSDLKVSEFFNKYTLLDNGKILKARKIKTKVTELDLLSFSVMYDFNITGCDYLEITNKSKFADDYIQQTLRYHVANKIEISAALNGQKTIEELNDFSGLPIFTATQVDNFNNMDSKEREEFLEQEYTATKTNGINNQYGILVQKIVNDNIIFDLEQYQFNRELDTIQGCNGRQTSRDYITGLYITAYARFDLMLLTLMLYIKCPEAQILYWDTDSVKLSIDRELQGNAKTVINEYNDRFKSIQEYAEDINGAVNNLGIWEDDGEYKYFYSMGAKKYVVLTYDKVEKRDVVKVTNSGINKKQFSKFLTDLYYKNLKEGNDEKQSFINVLNTAYHPNLVIGTDITGRKTITYPNIRDKKIKLKVIDENGQEQFINQYPTALITDCDYSLNQLDRNHILIKQHYQLCRALQQNLGIEFYCNTEINEIGTISKIKTDDFSDYVLF